MSSGNSFIAKRGDTSPALLYTMNPQPTTMTGATVVFNLSRLSDNVLVINRATADWIDANGIFKLRYQWGTGDLVDGQFKGEFEVTYADATIGSWPNKGFIPVNIGEDLA